jgi:PAS domain S-box-containing protein
MVGLALAWNVSLRREVRRRTQQYREAAAAQSESESQYRILFEMTPLPMWVFDCTTLKFLAVNDAAVSHYGYAREEFLRMTAADLRPPADSPRLEGSITDTRAEGVHETGRFRHRKKDGALIQVEIRSHSLEMAGSPARLVLVTDVTERLRLEEQLRQAHKMEAVGRLAGGVAHDFNNILNVIMGRAELLKQRVPDESPLRKHTTEILYAAERAAALTRQLLAFSRKQVLQPKVLDLNSVVGEMERLLRRLIGEDVRLVVSQEPHLGRVKADPGQMEQVLMNLVVNARDAMPRGGSLLIETRNVELDDAYVRSHAGAQPGSHVLLAVSDTGHGMDAETQRHIFEPFFTTKKPGKGTGLGLATVYGIVQQSGGFIAVYSEIGRGTTFKVYLPRVEGAVQTRPAPSPQRARGSESVLLVEDETSLRELTTELLEASGYHVQAAADGAEALAMSRRCGDPVDLLLTDVIMPGMTGRELAERLLSEHPETRVLYMSGYTDDAISQHGVLEHGVKLLSKPFTEEALTRKVREALGPPCGHEGRPRPEGRPTTDSRTPAKLDTYRLIADH